MIAPVTAVIALVQALFAGEIQNVQLQPGFLLRVNPIIAIARGPIVLRSDLTYLGESQIKISERSVAAAGFDDDIPRRDRSEGAIWVNAREKVSSQITLVKGTTASQLHFLHHQYEPVSAGRYRGVVFLQIRGVDHFGKPLAEFQVRLSVHVAPVDSPEASDSINRLVKAWEEAEAGVYSLDHFSTPSAARLIIDKGKIVGSIDANRLAPYSRIVDCLVFSDHSRIAEVGLHFLASGKAPAETTRLLPHVFRAMEDKRKAHAAYVNLACSRQNMLAVDVFRFWREQRIILPAAELARLRECANPWVRALAFATFGAGGSTKTASDAVADFYRPCPQEHFQKLLADLDSDFFIVRRKALAEIQRDVERYEAMLTEALAGEKRVAVRGAIAWLLEYLQENQRDSLWRLTLRYISSQGDDRSRAVLTALSTMSSKTTVSKAAAELLLVPQTENR